MTSDGKATLPPAYSKINNPRNPSNFADRNQYDQYPSQNIQPSPGGAQIPGYPGHVCDQQAVSLIAQPGIVPQVTNRVPHKDWMLPAVFACLCCFWPTAIAAISYASKANSAADRGDVEATKRYSANARNLVIASFVIGIILLPIIVLMKIHNESDTYPNY